MNFWLKIILPVVILTKPDVGRSEPQDAKTTQQQPANDDDGKYVYLITTSHNGQPPDRAGTGVLLPGAGGIVTCLHVVVGGDSFRVSNSRGVVIHDQAALRIVKVDVERDLAVLSSPEIARLKTGMNLALGADLSKLKEANMEVVGYPAGVKKSEFNIPIRVQKTPVRPLRDFLNDDLRESFYQ